jgi:hypothetical protein
MAKKLSTSSTSSTREKTGKDVFLVIWLLSPLFPSTPPLVFFRPFSLSCHFTFCSRL